MPLRLTEPPGDVLPLITAAIKERLLSQPPTAAMRQMQLVEPAAAVPHKVYSIGLDDLRTNDNPLARAKLVGWRYLIMAGSTPVMAAEVDCDENGGHLQFSHLHEGPLVGGFAHELTSAEDSDKFADANYELRVLRIPSLYMMALWFMKEVHHGDWFKPIAPTHHLFVAGQFYAQSDFIGLLKTAAAGQTFDNAPQGASATSGTVITPGGARPKEQAIHVPPGNVIRGGQKEGAFAVEPKQAALDIERHPTMSSDFVITPGGMRHRTMVHRIEPGHVVDGSAGRLRKLHALSQNMVADFGMVAKRAGGEPLMPGNVARPLPRVPAFGSGWIVYTSWTNNTGQPVTLFKTAWVVPPIPATQSGQTIFLFNGIQNSTMIYQPVLQWGPSAAGGGAFWAVASWYVDGQGGPAHFSNLVQVQPGDVLVGVMALTGQSAAGFNYNCVFQGIPGSSLDIQNVEELTWCIETLEAYQISQCSDYPATNKTEMSSIDIRVGGTEAPVNWAATNAVTDCNQHAVVVSNACPNGQVDLYYR